MSKILRNGIMISLVGLIALTGTAFAEVEDGVKRINASSGTIIPQPIDKVVPSITVPPGCDLRYSFFDDFYASTWQKPDMVKYISKSVAWCGRAGTRQEIDSISAKARLYTSSGILLGSKEDKTDGGSYAGVETDFYEYDHDRVFGYGNHIFKNAGYPDEVLETQDKWYEKATEPIDVPFPK